MSTEHPGWLGVGEKEAGLHDLPLPTPPPELGLLLGTLAPGRTALLRLSSCCGKGTVSGGRKSSVQIPPLNLNEIPPPTPQNRQTKQDE